MKFKAVLAALTIALAVGACSKAGDEAKAQSPAAGPTTATVKTLRVRPGLPGDPAPADQYKAWYHWYACTDGVPYFRCDYTSQTCLRGLSGFGGSFVGVVLGSDRQTVLAHVLHQGNITINYDTAQATEDGGRQLPQGQVSMAAPQVLGPPYSKSNCDVQAPE